MNVQILFLFFPKAVQKLQISSSRYRLALAVTKARSQRVHWVHIKLLFATTAASETMAGTNTIMDSDHVAALKKSKQNYCLLQPLWTKQRPLSTQSRKEITHLWRQAANGVLCAEEDARIKAIKAQIGKKYSGAPAGHIRFHRWLWRCGLCCFISVGRQCC